MVLPIAEQNPCRRVCVLLLLYILVAIWTILVAICYWRHLRQAYIHHETAPAQFCSLSRLIASHLKLLKFNLIPPRLIAHFLSQNDANNALFRIKTCIYQQKALLLRRESDYSLQKLMWIIYSSNYGTQRLSSLWCCVYLSAREPC